jgi:hypothetical protein
MTTSNAIQFLGYILDIQKASALKSTTKQDRYPRYVALMHSREAVRELVSALQSPASTTYAQCESTSKNGRVGVAVPFTALRSEMQFALRCIYLFRESDVPRWLHSQWLSYEVTEFELPGRAEGTHIKVPLEIAPPWEALPPAYVCCRAQASRIALLQQVLQTGAFLEPFTLLADDRAPEYRAYRAVPLGGLRTGAREQLEQTEQPYWYCMYESNLGAHPLLQPYYRRFELCKVGEEG